ncbi:hypothetical protein HanRHA438_Chr17g0801151 [Helianthus annuus]|nr:hypothetical protein HanRHA438_Chr17g0801151 [Helianthus annuus]
MGEFYHLQVFIHGLLWLSKKRLPVSVAQQHPKGECIKINLKLESIGESFYEDDLQWR